MGHRRSFSVLICILFMVWTSLNLITRFDSPRPDNNQATTPTLVEEDYEPKVLWSNSSQESRHRLVQKICHDLGSQNDSRGQESLPIRVNTHDLKQYEALIKSGFTFDRSLLYNKEHQMTYCWVHKVASTSWNRIFFQLVGKRTIPPKSLHTAAQRLKPNPSDLVKATSTAAFKFVFARHPFERILSAFVDKFEVGVVGNYIFAVYNPHIKAVNPEMSSIQTRPNFAQFVNYLIHTPLSKYNDHWIPIWMHCHMCQIDYNFIGDFETIQADSEKVLAELRLTGIEFPWHNNLKKHRGKHKIKAKSDDPMDYYRELSLDQIEALYGIYRVDFDMFGYSPRSYFELFA